MDLCQPANTFSGLCATVGRVTRQVLILSPLLFVGAAAVAARMQPAAHAVPSNSPAEDAALLAYGDYVMAAERATRNRDANEVRKTAAAWLDALERNDLHEIRPSSFEDSPRQGVKGQVIRAQMGLVNSLVRAERLATEQEEVAEQARDAAMAIRLASHLKLSDLRTSYNAANRQRRALYIIESLLPQMDEEQRREILELIPTPKENHAQLELLTVTSRQQYYDFIRRRGDEPLTIDDVRLTVNYTERAVHDKDGGVAIRPSSGYLLANPEVDIQFLTDLRLAWTQNLALDEELQLVRSKLGSSAR